MFIYNVEEEIDLPPIGELQDARELSRRWEGENKYDEERRRGEILE